MAHIEPLRRIRFWLIVFMAGLILSGITAFPLQTELRWLLDGLRSELLRPVAESRGLLPWIGRVEQAVRVTNAEYPFLAYGTDWLAFAHLVIAVVFIGPYRDPVRNQWVVLFGLMACGGVLPLALIAGQVRQIPLGWRMIDCSFGVLGCLPLWRCWTLIGKMEAYEAKSRVDTTS
jgi:hypothetical protein